MSMKGLSLLALVWGMEAADAAGLDSRLTHALQVQSEPVEGETAVNGMQFHVTRVTGRDVPRLFERIVATWALVPGHAPRMLRSGEWNMISRIRDGRSEVVQWRTGKAGAELLWSDTDLRIAPSAPTTPGYLPEGCRWNASVNGRTSGQRFLQFTGLCAADVSMVSGELERALLRKGWRVQHTPDGLRADRAGGSLEAVVTPTRGGEALALHATAVVLVEIHAADGAARRGSRR